MSSNTQIRYALRLARMDNQWVNITMMLTGNVVYETDRFHSTVIDKKQAVEAAERYVFFTQDFEIIIEEVTFNITIISEKPLNKNYYAVSANLCAAIRTYFDTQEWYIPYNSHACNDILYKIIKKYKIFKNRYFVMIDAFDVDIDENDNYKPIERFDFKYKIDYFFAETRCVAVMTKNKLMDFMLRHPEDKFLAVNIETLEIEYCNKTSD